MNKKLPFKKAAFKNTKSSIIRSFLNKTMVLCITFLLIKCSSISKYNSSLEDTIAPEKLHKDVDFAYKKLQKMHPQLYQYTSKEQLDFKFDSLKKTIKEPITSFEFFTKLSPVIANVKQGHTFTFPKTKKYTKDEQKKFKKQVSPFSQFVFEIFENKVYVVENKSKIKDIKIGDELTKINDAPVQEVIDESKKWITSDGYNTTFFDKFIAQRLGTFFTFKKQLQDSVAFEFNNKKSFWINRNLKDTTATAVATTPKKWTKTQKDSLVNSHKERSKFGYNKDSKKNNRTLTFIDKDSVTALLDIKSFTIGNFSAFYKESFEQIKKAKTKNLIIDLRNNFGGRLDEIDEFYSYLTIDSTYQIVNPSQVTQKTSLLKTDYFKGSKPITFVIKGILSPVFYSYMFFKVHKGEDGNYYTNMNTKEKKAKENRFTGKIYVLINGGSFSASSILATKLKGTNRATFIGEETGGDYNGTVAGMMPKIELPHSKVQVRIGLMYVNTIEKTTVKGHGIYPDVTITPKLEDRINNNDPEMNYILGEIKKEAIEKVVEVE